jgi:pilus assembly protein TadC
MTEEDLLRMLRQKSEIYRAQTRKRKLRVTAWDYFVHVLVMAMGAMVITMLIMLLRS